MYKNKLCLVILFLSIISKLPSNAVTYKWFTSKQRDKSKKSKYRYICKRNQIIKFEIESALSVLYPFNIENLQFYGQKLNSHRVQKESRNNFQLTSYFYCFYRKELL